VLQAEQQGLVYLVVGRAVGVSLAAGKAVEIKYSTAGRVVGVNCNATVGQQGIGLTARGIL